MYRQYGIVNQRRDKFSPPGEKVKRTLENAADKAGEELQRAGRSVENAASAVGDRIEKTASGITDAVRDHIPAPAQAVFGAAVGGLAGYLDSTYVEPCGQILGTALLCVQLMDHEGMVSLPWNNAAATSGHAAHHAISRGRTSGFVPALNAVAQEVREFAVNNVYIAAGFTGGYVLMRNFLNQ